jgi:hypothetical protein
MKTLSIIAALVALIFSHAAAQVTVELALNQEEFLPGESIPVAVKITNRSGQQLHLGAEPNWVTFSVEAEDGTSVIKNSEVPVMGEFDLESSQMGTKHVDIAPYFSINRPGRYTVTATLRIKAWGVEMNSAPKLFDVIEGAKLWSQDFGVPAASGIPEMRRFTLEQASYLHDQMRLYMQLSDAAESRIYKTLALGPTVSFTRPEAQVDRTSQLHVLWQSGAQSFLFCLINTDGAVLNREIYDDFGIRPKLVVNDNGDVLVVGGVRRPKPGELPIISPPVELPGTNSMPAPAK